MRPASVTLALIFGLTSFSPAYAQAPAPPIRPGAAGTVVAPVPGTTGKDRDLTISRGPTGASTIQTDSAAAGNAGHPSRRVPQGSGGGGSH